MKKWMRIFGTHPSTCFRMKKIRREKHAECVCVCIDENQIFIQKKLLSAFMKVPM